jgi:short-subunit dehydrogenase
LPADLSRPDCGDYVARELIGRGLEPAYVVNNAGFGLGGDAEALDRGEQLTMIDLNVRALTDLSLRWTGSIRRHRGGILNVASVAGFFPGPGMAVYFATKAYVLSFTEALHHELAPTGVRVTALCPGPVATRFLERARLAEADLPQVFNVSAEAVALAGYDGLLAGKRVVVPGAANRLATFMASLVPHRVALASISAQNKRRRKQRSPQPRAPTES